MPKTEAEWNALIIVMCTYIKHCIAKYTIIYWRGGEKELIEDVMQETFYRAVRYACGEKQAQIPSIGSFEALCKTIAKRYLLDLRRKDKRLVASIDATTSLGLHLDVLLSIDPSEVVLNDISQYTTLLMVAKAIKELSPKQKEAILVHLANMEDFDDMEPRPLERALWAIGIPLREYHRELPSNPVIRSRHTASLCLAIKALRQTLSCPPSQPDHAA